MMSSRKILIWASVILWLAGCQPTEAALPTYPALPTYTPYPTYTPLPTASPPTPTLELTPRVRLKESFDSEDTCLEIFSRPEASGSIQEEAFVLEAVSPDVITFSVCQTLVAGDFRLEVEATPLDWPEEGPYYYGLIFRVSGKERYAFVFGSEGGYCAYFATDQAYVPLTNSTDFVSECWARPPASAINKNTNRLGVTAVEDRIDLFMNGELLAVVRDHRLDAGRVGVIVAASSEGGVSVAFDNLIVTQP